MRLKDFLDSAPDGVLAIDRTDRIIYWNDSATEILGYDRAEAMGRPCHAVLKGMGERGTVLCSPECSLKSCAFRGDKLHNFNLLTAHKDGHTVWLNVSTLCVTDFEGSDLAVLHMFRDVDRLHRASDLLGEFVVRASEVHAPVTLPTKATAREPLTAREAEVLALLGDGLNAREIAQRLTISEATARNHIQNILGKLGVHSRLEAAIYAREVRPL